MQKECGEILGIELVDHIIVGDNDTYFSFKENCMM
ncbi:TPA: JAB domain-containing protein [Clostridioides difficile]